MLSGEAWGKDRSYRPMTGRAALAESRPYPALGREEGRPSLGPHGGAGAARHAAGAAHNAGSTAVVGSGDGPPGAPESLCQCNGATAPVAVWSPAAEGGSAVADGNAAYGRRRPMCCVERTH